MIVEQIGHGISEDFIRKVRVMSHQFFELPYEEKLKIKITPAAGYRFIPLISKCAPNLVSRLVRLDRYYIIYNFVLNERNKYKIVNLHILFRSQWLNIYFNVFLIGIRFQHLVKRVNGT